MAFSQVLEFITDLLEDQTIAKSTKEILTEIEILVNSEDDPHIKVDRAIHRLEELLDDVNLQPYTRSQLLNLVSLLENSLTH